MYIIKCFLEYSQKCAAITTVNFRTFLKRKPDLLGVSPYGILNGRHPLKIHAYLEPQNVTIFGYKVFAHVTS